MKRKVFLKRLAGIGAMTLLPASSLMATNSSSTHVPKKIKEKVITSEAGKALTILGNKQLHKLVGKDTNNQFFEWTDYLKPGAGIPPHVHTKEDEVFRIITGTVEFTIDGNTSVLKAGDIALAPKNITHSWRVVGNKDAQMNVSVFPAGMEFMFEELDKLPQGKPDLTKIAAISEKYGIHFVKP